MGYVSGRARTDGKLPFVSGGGGGGGITLVTSADSSIVVTNPAGPTVDLSATAASVGAVDITGDTMQGPLLLDGHNLVMGTGGSGGPGNITQVGSLAATSTITATSFNGVALTAAGSASLWLNEAGGYTAPAAADIAYSPTYADALTTGNTSTTVGEQLLWNETHTGTMSWIWGEPTLQAAFPVGAVTPDAYTVDRPAVVMTPLGGAPIVAPAGRKVDMEDPGSIDCLGPGKPLMVFDVAAPAVDGELVIDGLSVLNSNGDPAAEDFRATSPSGRGVRLESFVSLGNGGGTVVDTFGPAQFNVLAAPSAPGAKGINLDGTIVSALFRDGLSIAPPSGAYDAISGLSTATVVSQLVVSGQGMITSDPVQSLLNLDAGMTLPGGGPLPTDVVGTNVFACIVQGDGVLFNPSGYGADDIEIFSLAHQNGRDSLWIGDAIFESVGGGVPDARLDHVGQGGVPLIVPFNNVAQGGAGPTFRELTPVAAQERHTLILGTANIVSINAGGTYVGDGTYLATQAATSGVGSGAEFTVTVTGGTVVNIDSIDQYGAGGYVVGDTITLAVVGPTETVAAVLNVVDVAWLLRTDGPVGDLSGPVRWRVDHERVGGQGSTVFGYMARRAAGVGPWVEVLGSASTPQPLNTPLEATGEARISTIGPADEWTIFMVNDAVGSTAMDITRIEPFVEGR